MSQINVTLINCDRLQERPFKVKGGSGIEYGTAIYNRKEGGHVVTFPLDRLKEIHEDICRAAHLPLSKWRIHNVEVDHTEGETGQLVEALDKAQAELAQLAAELDNAKLDLARALDARDAALRAITTSLDDRSSSDDREDVLVDYTAEVAKEATFTESPFAKLATETAPEPVPEAPQAETGDKQEVAPTPDSVAPVSDKLTREELEANSSFRSIRNIAKKRGVPNYTAFDKRAELIDAILAHEAAAEANG